LSNGTFLRLCLDSLKNTFGASPNFAILGLNRLIQQRQGIFADSEQSARGFLPRTVLLASQLPNQLFNLRF
jgi:hypothetical protein